MTTATTENLTVHWQKIVRQVREEFSALPDLERRWIALRLPLIADMQRELQGLVDAVDIAAVCRACQGRCCDCGKNHFGLPNLLFYLLADEPEPIPEPDNGCPFLGAAGCRLEVGRRPFNCVIFICEEVETRLTAAARERYDILEQSLREAYLEFERRYAGAGAHGLLLRSERLGDRGFFAAGLSAEVR